ncbi:methylamine utilization protein [Roseateles sp. SL47]|uniref:methylamine utilization protein n=1 Tax=Roseateles sp. SL47 TaxID=2995138 RepID=UPI00226DF3A5|nr:methylamine utilization protein [Roseateles sp. SL47]WAC74422.1 methylamine utilization protein [Roseateles sp. SL47]
MRSRRPSAALLLAASAATALLSPLAASAAPWTLQVKDAAGAPLAGAVVAVELKGQPSQAAPGTVAQMAQRDRQFQPGTLVVQTGTAVSFPNFDTVRHHVYSFSPIRRFELKLYAGTPAEPVVFDKPGVAQLGCNIHDKMTARIIVVDTPLFATTDAQGQAKLDLPPGQHQVALWHARLGNDAPRQQSLVVPAGPPGGLALELRD